MKDKLIVSTPDTCFGEPRIAGTRIQVEVIKSDYNAGCSIENIMYWSWLTREQVVAAINYRRKERDRVK